MENLSLYMSIGSFGKEVRKVNILNAIPMSIMMILCCVMSYWHGVSKDGLKISGLIYTVILGVSATILVIVQPIFL